MRFNRYLLAGAALAGCLWTTAAFAEDAGAAGKDDSSNDIIVTAQFREQSIQDTPIAISAVTADMLDARGQTNIYEVANQVPSVTLKPSVAAWGPSLAASIRGVGQYNFNPALEPGVGVFVDDVYYATLTGSMLDLLDISRVEVLRGPQGTLTGRNSLGGAVRIFTIEPKGDDSGSVELTGGSRNLLGIRASLDVGLTDTLALRVSGMVKSQTGYVKVLDYGCATGDPAIPAAVNTKDCKAGDPQGGIGNQAVRAQLKFTPDDKFDFLLAGTYNHENHTGPGGVVTYADYDNPETNPVPGVPFDSRFVCGKYCNYATYSQGAGRDGYPAIADSIDPRTYYEGWSISGKANYHFNDEVTLTSITAYREYDTSFAVDDDQSPARLSYEATSLNHKFFSQEGRLNADLDKVQITLGGFYSWQDTFYYSFFDIRPYFLQYYGKDDVRATSAAAFATAIAKLTDKLTLTAGIRYTHERKTYTFHHFNMDGTVNDPAIEGTSPPATDSVVDYRASLDYRWSDHLLTYATFATGFKGGGINPFPAAAALVLPFGPEKLKNYEVGLKSDFFDNRLRFNLTGFYDKYSGVQLTRLDVSEYGVAFGSLIVNAGNATMKGFEAEFSGEPVDGLQFNSSLSYLDFKFDYINPATFLAPDIVPPFAPAWKWSVGAQYEIGLGNSTLTPRIDVSYQSHIYTNAANAPTNRIDGYTVASGSLTWANEKRDLTVALHVDNLFNKYYFLNNFDLTGTSGLIESFPGAPREFSLVVRKAF
ncbi:MAG: TonB-dependent receptor [Novosphingobium sp.]|nr:TonB-dependent receptor [Novosphingobium sp.]